MCVYCVCLYVCVVAMSSANGLVDTGFASRYWLQLREDFLKG